MEAREIFEEKQARIDLIVCDWKMPGMSGKEFLELVRRYDTDLPFIMVTAKDRLESVLDAADSGVSAYITKPFNPELLRRRIIDTMVSGKKK
jgi:DNA-binding response OmpR family regulator